MFLPFYPQFHKLVLGSGKFRGFLGKPQKTLKNLQELFVGKSLKGIFKILLKEMGIGVYKQALKATLKYLAIGSKVIE